MNTIQSQVEGEFLLTVSGPRGRRDYRAPNLITDIGLDRLFVGGVFGMGAPSAIQIGTGNAAPAATDTTLQSFSAAATAVQGALSQSYTAGPPDYHTISITHRFALGALNGNYSEVGIGWTSPGNLWSRALIVNGGGSPTPITILSDEQLDVTYVCRIYPPAGDTTGSITLDGVTYSYTMRPAGVNLTDSGFLGGWALRDFITSGVASGAGLSNRSCSMGVYDGAIGSRTGSPSGASVGSGVISASALPYVSGAYQRTFEFTMDLNVCNIAGGIKSYLAQFIGSGFVAVSAYQIEFTPKIPKDATKRLRLDIRYSFARRP